jgi:predicted site-specific integrase-resolvase
MNNHPQQVWLDKQDILTRMHISNRTLQTWRKEKILPYYQVKGKIYYKESDLNKMMENGRV